MITLGEFGAKTRPVHCPAPDKPFRPVCGLSPDEGMTALTVFMWDRMYEDLQCPDCREWRRA